MTDATPLAAGGGHDPTLLLLAEHSSTLGRLGVLRPALRVALMEQALSQAAIALPPPELQQKLEQRFWRQQRIAPEQRSRWMQQQGLRTTDVAAIASRAWRWRAWCEQQWQPKLEALFLKHKHNLDRATAFLLELEDAGLAQELYFQLAEERASFLELSRRHCHDHPQRRGGQIGPTCLGELAPAIAQLIRSSPRQQLREPVKIGPQRWAIVRVEQFIDARVDDPAIVRQVFRLEGEAEVQRWIEDWLDRITASRPDLEC